MVVTVSPPRLFCAPVAVFSEHADRLKVWGRGGRLLELPLALWSPPVGGVTWRPLGGNAPLLCQSLLLFETFSPREAFVF